MTATASAVAQERGHEHQLVRRKQREARDREAPRCRRRDLLNHSRAQLFAFPQRHNAVAGAGALSDAEGCLWPQLCADRDDHPGLAGDLIAAATGGRAVRRSPPAALFTRHWDGCDARRTYTARERRQLLDARAGGGTGRGGLRGLSPGSLAGGADGIGRTPWLGAIAVPGRRQYRFVARADFGCLYRDSEGPIEHRLVFPGGAAGDDRAVRRRELVQERARWAAALWRKTLGRAALLVAAEDRLVGGDPDGVSLFQILLYVEPQQLLHFLPDQQVRRFARECPVLPVRLSGGRCTRNIDRGPGRRPDRPQIRLVGLDRRCAAVHPGAALRRSVVDRYLDHSDRADPGFSLIGDHRLCAGAGAGKNRYGRRAVLRSVLWYGRGGRGGTRPVGRRDEYRLC